MINRKVSIMLLPQVFFYKKRKPLSSLIPQGLPPFHQHDLEHQIPQQEEGQKPQELTLRSQELLEQGPRHRSIFGYWSQFKSRNRSRFVAHL